MKKNTKDIIIIGFALFAMFFGAGNLIFPPSLGNSVGSSYPIAILGFMVTGVGLPLLAIMACANYDGNFKLITDNLGKRFSLFFNIVLMLVLGPLVVIPRTAATTYELGVQPSFSWISPIIVIAIYFLINIFFLLKPSSIVDLIGKFLTPTLLLVLIVIIIKGIISPFGAIGDSSIDNVLSHSFVQGYQTMDALGAVVVAGIVISSIKSKGYTSKDDIIKMTLKAGLIAIGGLAVIYGGLTILGAQTADVVEAGAGKSALLIAIAQNTLGSLGLTALSIVVSLACLTTSIGLTANISEFFERESNGKISYKSGVVIISALSAIVATLGVDNIVKFASPILDILYPIVMVILFTSFIAKHIGSFVIKVTSYTTLAICILNFASSFGVSDNALNHIISKLPLSSYGFYWITPTLIAFIISYAFSKTRGKSKEEVTQEV